MQGAARPTNNRNGGSILVRLLAVIFECTPSNIRALSSDNDVRDSRIYVLAFSFLEVAAQRSEPTAEMPFVLDANFSGLLAQWMRS